MDTSETYIAMCRAATEVQLLAPTMQTRIHIRGNIYNCSTKDDSAFFWCMDTFEDDNLENSILTNTVASWLPRQDQLQAIVRQEPLNEVWIANPTDAELLMLFLDFIYDEIGQQRKLRISETMEQLWLMFVMEEKYSKQWMGEEWVEI